MLKTLAMTTAISALMIGGAVAQTTGAPSSGASSSTTAAAPVQKQNPDQWLASKFNGTDVIGDDNQKIGDVTDILFDKNGKIEAYIVSVGGFLGIGSKHVALAPTTFKVMPADTNSSYERLKLSMTKDQLQQAANFEPYSPPRPQTTGSGPGSMGGSSGMAPRPSSNTGPSSGN
jgi:sporulation protein YlmC with PRC-barrel domain